MASLIASLRLVAATLLVCVLAYTALILGAAQCVPDTALGSLIRDRAGRIIGSRLIAQNFTRKRYFWPRPSAAGTNGYDAMRGAGSNKSPTSRDLALRARQIVARYGASMDNLLPPDLAAASGSGLDPDISMRAALYQSGRVARARGIPVTDIKALIKKHSRAPGGWLTPNRLVNVLELNLALDAATSPLHRP